MFPVVTFGVDGGCERPERVIGMGFRVTDSEDGRVLNADVDEASALEISRRYNANTGRTAEVQRFDVDADGTVVEKGRPNKVGADKDAAKK